MPLALSMSACAPWSPEGDEPAGLETPRGLAFSNVSHSRERLPWRFSAHVDPVWRVLAGAAIISPPTVTPDGRVYLTSGRGVGHAHLHAYDADGALRWEARAMESLEDLDHGAALSSPLVDPQGNVYVSDANQVWSFGPGGAERWRSIEFERLDVDGQLLQPSFVRVGKKTAVGGVTSSGELLLFDRDGGILMAEVHRFPGAPMPALGQPPEGLWVDASDPEQPQWLVAEDYVPTLWAVLTGSGQRAMQPAAVSPVNGRLFVVASGERPGQSMLYGVDAPSQRGRRGRAISKVAFAVPITGARPVGPVVSVDGRRVYVIADQGLHAFDAGNGRELWRYRAHKNATIMPVAAYDDVVYTVENGADGGSWILAIHGASGQLRWRRSAGHLLARELLPHDWLGDRVAVVDSRPVLASDALWLVVNLGYQPGSLGSQPGSLGPAARRFVPYSAYSVAAALDLRDGSLTQTLPLQLSNSGHIVPSPNDGALYVASDAWRDTVNFARGQRGPSDMRTFSRPVAGLAAYAPKDSDGYVGEGFRQVVALLDQLEAALPERRADPQQTRRLSAMALLQYDVSARVADESIAAVIEARAEMDDLHDAVMGRTKASNISKRIGRLRQAVRQIAALYSPPS